MMAGFGLLTITRYLDEIMGVAAAIGAYATHRDESRLAEDLVKQVLSAVEDTIGDVPDDIEQKVTSWVGDSVQIIEDIISRT